MKNHRWAFAAIAATAWSLSAQAEPCASVTRANLVECALAASLTTRAERREVEAIEGRFTATNPIFPSNPSLALWGSRRFGPDLPDRPTYGWYAQLSQELEIAGQRGSRRDVVRAQRDAQNQNIVAVQRDAIANAWSAWFDALAAIEDLNLVRRIENASRRSVEVTSGAAAKGLLSGVDADVADALFLRITQARIVAEQRERKANAALAALLGLDPAVPIPIAGDLDPLSVTAPASDAVVDMRPEVRALDAERHSMESRASYFRRLRFPNPTVSFFAQNDEVNQPVLGIGIAFPLVLPQPIGHTYAGEIEESEALVQKAGVLRDRARRDAREELAVARQAYESSQKARDLYTEQRVTRADKSLLSISAEIEAGRLAVKDAIVAQQSLMDMLRAAIESKRALCLASVALARASGSFDRGGAP